MILPLGAISPDTAYPFSNYYGIGYGASVRVIPSQPSANTEIRDTVTLSPAALRWLDETQRMKQ